MPIGNYHRYLYQGNYDITFTKNGYHPKTINTTILNHNSTIEDIQLVPINIGPTAITEQSNKKSKNILLDILGRKNKEEKGVQFIKSKTGTVKKQIILK